MTRADPPLVDIDARTEEAVRQRLLEHFAPTYGARVDGYVADLMSLENVQSRFNYVERVVAAAGGYPAGPALVSGFGVGSEMILARRCGFAEVAGVEVDPFLLEICRQRLAALPGMSPVLYDGHTLPQADRSVALVLSGHIIEHTADPRHYLLECLRVLVPGGYLFLEFPTRYHRRELHTGLPSLEWLPRPLRNLGLRLASHRWSPLQPQTRRGYEAILGTGLKQVSLRWVRAVVRSRGGHDLVDVSIPAPGVVRSVFRRGAGA